MGMFIVIALMRRTIYGLKNPQCIYCSQGQAGLIRELATKCQYLGTSD